MFITGFMNFIPGTGAIISSVGVIIFSSIIIFSFVKMNTLMTINYNRLTERQKKLDYTGELTTSLIHEVNNNLQIIKAYSKMLPQSTPLTTESTHMVQMIQKASKQLEDLTRNYAVYINRNSVDFKMVDLNTVIDGAIDIVSEMVKEKRIDLFFEKKYKPLKAYVSETFLKQVFINLIKNSCESITEEKEARSIKIETIILADQIYIDIIDTGHGIQAKNWEEIFDPFISSKSNGMGVGLPFVRKIIFEHRGEISVHESSPMGTTFRIKLPQYEFSELYKR
ncbi:sensor histidine kinase [Jeotgalibacillus soli]|uniref:sensor histidine kinase n=1 Tax=Jeotgalibacillus soli TaxID=889306 RepID=UPI0012FEB856|nr:HAMP domain-containing sensor histidine kinase [Jeotgalibacillus soli]